MSNIKVGMAPISWTNDDMPTLGGKTQYQQILSEVALAGFKGTEIGSKYPKDPAVLKPQLEMRGICIASAWCGVRLTEQPYEQVEKEFVAFRDYLHTLGAKMINVCEQGGTIQGQMDTPILDDHKPNFTDAQWDALCEGLDKLGEKAAEVGMQISYHHHMGTGVQTAAEIDRLMEHTDPSKVKLLLDVGHLLFCGEDPAEVTRRYADRIGHVHLKDARPEVIEQAREQHLSFLRSILAGVFTVPGDGPTDFRAVLQPLLDNGYDGWFMVEAELDPEKSDPFAHALVARKCLREELGL